MVIDIKMCRFENVPWGFRLVGGSDFEYPLTVVKVTEGSIAEEAGLQVGDVIVRINDTPASSLAHSDANQIIKHCGNVFYFGVYREDANVEDVPKQFPIINVTERPATPQSFQLEVYHDDVDINTCKSPVPFEHQLNSDCHYVNVADDDDEDEDGDNLYFNKAEHEGFKFREGCERPNSVMSENTEIKLVEEEIAAVLSGETQVLKEHNVLGIFPKPGVCMSSDVLRTLNEEATKTKLEMDKEKKKWTTFLQKPDRPIPKSKQQLEAERRAANAYKVQIGKSAPPVVTPTLAEALTVTPEPTETASPEPEPEPTPAESIAAEPEIEEPLPEDTEVPNLKEISGMNTNDVVTLENEEAETNTELDPEAVNMTNDEGEAIDTEPQEVSEISEAQENEATEDKEVEKSPEEIALEGQLADVQKQLVALSSLPSTIQATLDAVTKQLADLLPAFKLQQSTQQTAPLATKTEEPREIVLETEANQEDSPCTADVALEQNSSSNWENEETCLTKENYENSNEKEKSPDMIQQVEEHKHMNGNMKAEDDGQVKKPKKHDVIEELEEQLQRKTKTSRSKRAFGPLTPSSERPLVLPGGRRWYRPKDAFNDEFIAETLSAQAELITGTTLGVNFMKYQKPEKKIDYNRSEVYKVIHHLDRQPVRGIEVRPPVVPAEQDIRKAVQSA